jgi:hypothetical protein
MNTIIDKIISDKSEDIRFILGKSNIDSSESKPSITITNRNVYFVGEHYRYGNGDVYGKNYGVESITLDDFIGAGYIHKRSRRNLYYLVFTGVSISILSETSKKLVKLGFDDSKLKLLIFILAIVFIVLLPLYLLKRYKLLEIAFVGKRICVKEQYYTKHDIQQFIGTIYQVKKENNIYK